MKYHFCIALGITGFLLVVADVCAQTGEHPFIGNAQDRAILNRAGAREPSSGPRDARQKEFIGNPWDQSILERAGSPVKPRGQDKRLGQETLDQRIDRRGHLPLRYHDIAPTQEDIDWGRRTSSPQDDTSE